MGLLADGQFHSGTELGESLGISRAAVWKQLQKLEAEGVSVESVKGKGYRLAAGLQLLDQNLLNSELQQTLGPVHYSLTTASTNADALQAIQQCNQHGALFVTERQTAGRGRRGRTWVSPFAQNLYFSLVWSFEGGAAALEGLSLMVGVSLVKAMEQQGVKGLQLKWPNDIWLGGKKLGGILLEMSGDASGFCQVVIGVGLNVAMESQDAEGIEQPWTSLRQHLPELDRTWLLIQLVQQLAADLECFADQGFAAFKSPWQEYDICCGCAVVVSESYRQLQGVARGVDESGALLLDADGERHVLHGGEVSLRLEELR